MGRDLFCCRYVWCIGAIGRSASGGGACFFFHVPRRSVDLIQGERRTCSRYRRYHFPSASILRTTSATLSLNKSMEYIL